MADQDTASTAEYRTRAPKQLESLLHGMGLHPELAITRHTSVETDPGAPVYGSDVPLSEEEQDDVEALLRAHESGQPEPVVRAKDHLLGGQGQSASPSGGSVRSQSADLLSQATVALKTLEANALNAHWRIRGPEFLHLHPWLGQYSEALRGYADQAAERCQAVGGDAPAIPGGQEMPTQADQIITELLRQTTSAISQLRGFRHTADAERMVDTFDLLTQIIRGLEERWGWPLAALLGTAEQEDPEAAVSGSEAPESGGEEGDEETQPERAPQDGDLPGRNGPVNASGQPGAPPEASGAQNAPTGPSGAGAPEKIAPDAHLQAASGVAGPSETVYQQLAEDFPPEAIEWVRAASWRGPVMVSLDQIDFSGQDSWAAAGDPARVKQFQQKIKKGQMKPIILVNEPNNAKLIVVDGHHRAVANQGMKRDVLAYVGTVGTVTGPWNEMHASQSRGDSGPRSGRFGPDSAPPSR